MCEPMTSSCSIMTLCNCFAVKSACVVVFCLLLLFEIVVLSSCLWYIVHTIDIMVFFLCLSLADVLVLLTLIHRHISNAAPACSLVLYVIFLGLKLVLLIIV